MNVPRRSLIALLVLGAGLGGYALGRFPATVAAAADAAAPAVAGPLPADVYPESRNRLPLVRRDDLDALGQGLYDEIVRDPRSLAGLQGPGGIRLSSPKLYNATRATNQFLRFDAGFERSLAELAILVTAREMDHTFEWFAHESAGRTAGLDPAIIDIVRYRRPTTGLRDPEATVIALGREAVGEHRVTPATYAQAYKLFGREKLVNLANLMGDYASTAIMLTIFDQRVPPGTALDFPVPASGKR